MNQPPAEMAANGDDLWLVMPTRQVGGRWQREVYATHVERNPATGLYFTTPAGRLEMESPLIGLGRLAGFAAGDRGPVALLLPTPRSATPAIQLTADDSPPALNTPRLLRLDPAAGEWAEIKLPEEFVGSRTTLLGCVGDDLLLLEGIPGNPARCVAHFKRGDGEWTSTAFALDIRRVRSLINVAGQFMAVVNTDDANRIDLSYVRPSGLLAVASIPAPQGKFLIAGLGDRIVVVERERGGAGDDGGPKLRVVSVDPLTGAAGQREDLIRQPLTAGRLWQVTLALGLSLSAVLAVVLLRPPPAERISVHPEAVLPLGRRTVAFIIDFVLACVPTLLVLDCTPADFLAIPIATIDFEKAGPYLLAAGIMTTMTTAAELASNRSIGKSIVGARLVGLDGSSPARWRVAVRGIVRFMVLVVPPLAVFALTNNHMQGLPDMAARTLVIGRTVKEP